MVTAITGRRQYHASLTGEAEPRGSTRMADRRDALAGAAHAIAALESLGRELDGEAEQTVITVGRLDVEPNAVNVIPGAGPVQHRYALAVGCRPGPRRRAAARPCRANRRGARAGARDGMHGVASRCPLDRGVCERLRDAASRLGIELPDTASGALHDTAILAPFLPAAMLFVASRDGISHNPAEFSRIEHIAAGGPRCSWRRCAS